MPHVTPSSNTNHDPHQSVSTNDEIEPTSGADAHRFGDFRHRLGHPWRRRDELQEGRDVECGPSDTLGQDVRARRRSLLRDKLRRGWQGKSTAGPAAHRRLKSEERPATPAVGSSQETERKRRAVSEDGRPVLQDSCASSVSRTLVNSTKTTDGDAATDAHGSRIATPDNTSEATEPAESVGTDEDMHVIHRDAPSRRRRKDDDSSGSVSETVDLEQLNEELDTKWILNLTLQFRDDSGQEKMFFNYAEKPNFWRRVTVTWSNKNVRPKSMEAELQSLPLNRDKSLQLYTSLRKTLPDVRFFPTVTNLRIVTEDDERLHIYVSEDLTDMVDYPDVEQARDIDCPRYKESQVFLDAHLSGFVYRVHVDNKVMVKKEIPRKGHVVEFMYELDALDALRHHESIIDIEGLVTDEAGEHITALLISNAAKGALVDIIHELRDTSMLPWPRRRRWAGQIISGLAAMHEAGFVQGDLTMNNVVVNEDDNAQIIDMNRRGCPVGFEPPELMRFILCDQEVQMLISTKTDLFQLGMLLWGLAERIEDPERVDRKRLNYIDDLEVPEWYRAIVRTCLSQFPEERKSAMVLLEMFQKGREDEGEDVEQDSCDGSRPADPRHVVTHDDIREHKRMRRHRSTGPDTGPSNMTYVDTHSGRIDSQPWWSEPRGRSGNRSQEGASTTRTSVSGEEDESLSSGAGEPEFVLIPSSNDRSRGDTPQRHEGETSHSSCHSERDDHDEYSYHSYPDAPSSTDDDGKKVARSIDMTHQDSSLRANQGDEEKESSFPASSVPYHLCVLTPTQHQDSGLGPDLDLVAGMDDDSRFQLEDGGRAGRQRGHSRARRRGPRGQRTGPGPAAAAARIQAANR